MLVKVNVVKTEGNRVTCQGVKCGTLEIFVNQEKLDIVSGNILLLTCTSNNNGGIRRIRNIKVEF